MANNRCAIPSEATPHDLPGFVDDANRAILWPPELAGGAHRLDGQLTVVLDVDRVLEIMPKAALAA
jgi:hypothetical protein